MRISTLSLFSALAILPIAQGHWGRIIMGWLHSVGIKYVPTVVPAPPSCTDCRGRPQPVSCLKQARVMLTFVYKAYFAFQFGRLFWDTPVTCPRLPLPCCPGTEPTPLPATNCTCGIEGSTRIVGGTDSKVREKHIL